MHLFCSNVMRIRRLFVLFVIVGSSSLAGCERIENQFVRWTGAEGDLHAITLVHLLAAGRQYDRLNIGVGGYIGPNFLGEATSLYFVPEHIVVTDPQVGIWLVGEDEMISFENICENIGSYIYVFGKYNHKDRHIHVDKVTLIKAPDSRMDRIECEQLTKM